MTVHFKPNSAVCASEVSEVSEEWGGGRAGEAADTELKTKTPPIYLSVYTSEYLSIYQSIYLSIDLSFYLSIYLSI